VQGVRRAVPLQYKNGVRTSSRRFVDLFLGAKIWARMKWLRSEMTREEMQLGV
jgi:hypothetical protein